MNHRSIARRSKSKPREIFGKPYERPVPVNHLPQFKRKSCTRKGNLEILAQPANGMLSLVHIAST